MLHVDIITPARRVYSEEVDAVFVPTDSGQIGVLPKHIALFTTLTEGEIKLVKGQKEWFIAIAGGFMEVVKNNVSVLVARAAHADELNEAEIKKAQALAKETLKHKGEAKDLADAQAILRRSILEMKVLTHERKRRSLTIH